MKATTGDTRIGPGGVPVRGVRDEPPRRCLSQEDHEAHHRARLDPRLCQSPGRDRPDADQRRVVFADVGAARTWDDGGTHAVERTQDDSRQATSEWSLVGCYQDD
jgi:hypothetical protein